MNILLFDMDGVLLESLGYHRALQETVRLAAEALGLRDMTLSMEDIAAFESVQMTSEWDSAATSAALLLAEAWRVDPARRLPEDRLEPAAPLAGARRPDFKEFALMLGGAELSGLTPLQRSRHLLLARETFPAAQQAHLESLLERARTTRSVLFRAFQELVLGSAGYLVAYGGSDGIRAQFDTPSYLLLHDRRLLEPGLRRELLDWLAQPGRAAAVMTSRPNLPPGGVFGTPEAELGLQLAAQGTALASWSVSGWGTLCWLGAQFACDPQEFLKPDPVHALAALQLALGAGPEQAAERAYRLSRLGEAHGSWHRLDGGRMSVFEDTRGGLLSVQAAGRLLAEAGIRVETNLIGIATSEIKVRALQTCGAWVYPDLAQALRSGVLR